MSARESLRILLVDDHIDSLQSLGNVLRSGGHDVRTAIDGVEALSRAMKLPPHVALINLTLPLIDGFDVARHMRARDDLRHIILIALTDWASDIHARRARMAGFDAHLVKPVGVPELARALERVRDNLLPPLRQRSH